MRPDKRWRDNNNKDLEEKTLRMKKMREEKRQNMVESKDLTLGKSHKKRRRKTEDK